MSPARRRRWIAGGAVFVVLVAAVGIGREIVRDEHAVVIPGFDVELTENDRAATMLLTGTDWVLEQPTLNGGPGCARLRIAGRATSCLSLTYGDGSYGVSVVRAPDGRGFVQVFGDAASSVRLYTSGRTAHVVDAVVVDVPGAEVGVVVVELAVDEEPYGIQVLDAAGDLVSVTSLVGSLG